MTALASQFAIQSVVSRQMRSVLSVLRICDRVRDTRIARAFFIALVGAGILPTIEKSADADQSRSPERFREEYLSHVEKLETALRNVRFGIRGKRINVESMERVFHGQFRLKDGAALQELHYDSFGETTESGRRLESRVLCQSRNSFFKCPPPCCAKR